MPVLASKPIVLLTIRQVLALVPKLLTRPMYQPQFEPIPKLQIKPPLITMLQLRFKLLIQPKVKPKPIPVLVSRLELMLMLELELMQAQLDQLQWSILL